MNKTFNSYLSFEAALAGLSALGYAYFFVVAKDPMMYSLFLLLSGLFATKVMVGLYLKLRDVGQGFALLGAVFGVLGSVGMLVHGGYDLANALNMPDGLNTALPNQLDPRGLLSFGATGLAMLYISWLMNQKSVFPHKPMFPKNLAFLGSILGVLLLWIYVARLIVIDPTNPILLYPVLVTGFVISPLWYLWLAKVFKEEK